MFRLLNTVRCAVGASACTRNYFTLRNQSLKFVREYDNIREFIAPYNKTKNCHLSVSKSTGYVTHTLLILRNLKINKESDIDIEHLASYLDYFKSSYNHITLIDPNLTDLYQTLIFAKEQGLRIEFNKRTCKYDIHQQIVDEFLRMHELTNSDIWNITFRKNSIAHFSNKN
jgi:hypothetical protein